MLKKLFSRNCLLVESIKKRSQHFFAFRLCLYLHILLKDRQKRIKNRKINFSIESTNPFDHDVIKLKVHFHEISAKKNACHGTQLAMENISNVNLLL